MNGVEGLKVLYGILNEINEVVYNQSLIETELSKVIKKSKDIKISEDLNAPPLLMEAFNAYMKTVYQRTEIERKINHLQSILDNHKKEVQAIERIVLKRNRIGGLQAEHFDNHVFDAIETARMLLEQFNQRTVILKQSLIEYKHFADQINLSLKSNT